MSPASNASGNWVLEREDPSGWETIGGPPKSDERFVYYLAGHLSGNNDLAWQVESVTYGLVVLRSGISQERRRWRLL